MDARYKILLASVLLAAWPATTSLARFDPSDAAQIDPEEASNTETWNDKNSYRYPLSWQRDWQTTEMGYRVNAGSLNVSRFDFTDDIQITPRPLETFSAGFTQSRREDLAEQTIERELRIGWAFAPGMRLSALGDADTLKEFGDMGLALALHEAADHRTEIYAWGVDYYYKSKRSDDAAFRTKDTKTYGFRSEHRRPGDQIRWQIRGEWDTPLDWTLPSQGWRYRYDRRLLDGRVELWPSPSHTLYASTRWERKSEGKTSLTPTDSGAIYKSMLRDALVTELGREFEPTSNTAYTLALQRIWRRVHYNMSPAFSAASIRGETKSPSDAQRNEWGLIATKSALVTEHWNLQQGIMANDVAIREDQRSWKTFEVKYQCLFDLRLNDRTRFALNTTWDIDQIIRDYPYPKTSPFRPWGGGDLQFMMKL